MNQPVSSRVLDAAIAWQLALDDEGGTSQARAEFERWYGAHEEHARAWHQLSQLDLRLHGTTAPARKALMQPQDGLRRRLRKLGSGLASVALAGVLLVYLGERGGPLDYWLADQRTATGEQRTLQLADGTRIDMNTHSAIDIRYDASHRLIVLRQGEILVETGHREGDSRPLTVQTADGLLRPLGTRFLVRSDTQGTLLGVLQAAVAATPRRKGTQHLVPQGQQLWIKADGGEALASLPPGADAWMHGMLVVDNARLADVVGELGRYRTGYLGVDPQVADLRITGSFPLANTDLALQALLPNLPVQIQHHTRWWTTVTPHRTL